MTLQVSDPAAGSADEQAPGHSSGSAGADAATASPGTAEAAAQGQEAAEGGSGADEQDILSQEEYEKVKDDPAALRKAYNAAYTQKTQALAKHRRLIEAIEADPVAAVRQLAAELEIPLGGQAGEEAGDGDGKAAEDPEMDAIREALTDSLGEDLAGKLLDPITKLVGKIADARVKPVAEQMDQQLLQSALAESESVVNGFKGAYPDYAKFESRMLELARIVQPGKDVDEATYLRTLYRLAKSEAAEGDITKGVIKRVQESARTSEPPTSAVAAGKVGKRAPSDLKGKDLVRAAVQAAMRGEAWED